jgi:hypothetical protein
MMSGEYKCFKFEDQSLLDQEIGPAYKEDMIDDAKIDNGTNNPNSNVVKLKVMQINGVFKLADDLYSDKKLYWFSIDTGVVYDYVMSYPIGRVLYDKNNIPMKLDNDTYIIGQKIPIVDVDVA